MHDRYGTLDRIAVRQNRHATNNEYYINLKELLMSTLKINRLRTGIVLSFLMLISTFFFVNAMDKKEMVKVVNQPLINQTWYFTGSASDNPELASNYSSSPAGLPTCGLAQEVICQITAPDDGTGKPKMDAPVDGTSIQLQIRAAHQSITDNNPATNSTVLEFRAE